MAKYSVRDCQSVSVMVGNTICPGSVRAPMHDQRADRYSAILVGLFALAFGESCQVSKYGPVVTRMSQESYSISGSENVWFAKQIAATFS